MRRKFAMVMLVMVSVLAGLSVGYAGPLDNWVVHNTGYTGDFLGVTYGDGLYVAVGGNTIYTSPDANMWTQRYTTGGISVAYGNGTYVTTDLLTSGDGIDWTQQTSGGSFYLEGVAYGNGKFVASGFGGIILTSPDGIHWTQQNSLPNGLPNPAYLEDVFVFFVNGQFVAVGGLYALVYTSPDGVVWTKQDAYSELPQQNYGYLLGAVAYGPPYVSVGGFYYGTSCDGFVLNSTDMTKWAVSLSPAPACLYGVVYGDNTFVATGANGTILTSSDGLTWTQRNSGVTNSLNKVIFGNGNFVAVGSAGTILTLSTAPVHVRIDIMTGLINPKSKGKIPVAILSTNQFDAYREIDRSSLTFGRTGNEQSLSFCDTNTRHGTRKDLICHFDTQDAEFMYGDTKGILKGRTRKGVLIEGSDSVRIGPCK